MFAIISLLDETHTRLVTELWNHLKTTCGLEGVFSTPLPHFSWHVAEAYWFTRLEPILIKIAQQTQPFTVRSTGVGIFNKTNPVIFLPLVRQPELTHIHQKLWRKVAPVAQNSSLFYDPTHWMPHITLAYNDVTPERLTCAIHELAFEALDWEIQIDNLAVVCQDENQVGHLYRKYPFSQAVHENRP